jgi:hypothetical protein
MDIRRIEEALRIGRPQTQVVNPQLGLLDFGQFRVLVTEGRLQIEVPPNAARSAARRGIQEALRQVANFQPTGVGFNGILRVDLDEDDGDPSRGFVDLDRAAQVLGAEPRGGLRFVYPSDGARMTLSLDPDGANDRLWLFHLNRHFDSMPNARTRDRAIDWLQELDSELPRLAREVFAGAEVGNRA